MLYHFSVVTFLNFLFVFKQFYCDIFGCGFLYIHLVGLYIFWMYRLMFFIRFGKFSVHSLNIFSALSTPQHLPTFSPSSLSCTHITHVLVYFLVSHISVNLFIFFFLPLFFMQYNLFWPIFKLSVSSLCQLRSTV